MNLPDFPRSPGFSTGLPRTLPLRDSGEKRSEIVHDFRCGRGEIFGRRGGGIFCVGVESSGYGNGKRFSPRVRAAFC